MPDRNISSTDLPVDGLAPPAGPDTVSNLQVTDARRPIQEVEGW